MLLSLNWLGYLLTWCKCGMLLTAAENNCFSCTFRRKKKLLSPFRLCQTCSTNATEGYISWVFYHSRDQQKASCKPHLLTTGWLRAITHAAGSILESDQKNSGYKRGNSHFNVQLQYQNLLFWPTYTHKLMHVCGSIRFSLLFVFGYL